LKNKKLKIYFADFWNNFKFQDNYFYHLLNTKYELEITHNNPDVLFHSVDYYGKSEYKNFQNKNTKKIFFTGESTEPDYNLTDYSFSFMENNEKNYRLPLWVLYIDWFNTKKDKERDPSFLIPLKKLTQNKTKITNNPFFCSFIASKPEGERINFVKNLDDIKKVHSMGRLYSNSYFRVMGRGDQKKKLDVMKLFKFNIAFENKIVDGYVTEKILHSLYAGSIPIYWGSSQAKKDFNPDSFIYHGDFKNDSDLIDNILKTYNDKDLMANYLNEPIFKNNKIPDFIMPENVLTALSEFIEQ
tara:strand:- start:644 stop:1543 length:900 start_codon:yes stop_codon:yes gene_type:complete